MCELKQEARSIPCHVDALADADAASDCLCRRPMDDAPPPWALTDASAKTLLVLGVQTADGSMQAIVPRGSSLPAHGEVVLTTSTHDAEALRINIFVGARPARHGHGARAPARHGRFESRIMKLSTISYRSVK